MSFKYGDVIVPDPLKFNGNGKCDSDCGNLNTLIKNNRVDHILITSDPDEDGSIRTWKAINTTGNVIEESCCSIKPYGFKLTPAMGIAINKNIQIQNKGGELLMNTVQNSVLDEDTKTLIKAGVLTSGLEVTDSNFVLSFVVNTYKKELATEAKRVLTEAKADK